MKGAQAIRSESTHLRFRHLRLFVELLIIGIAFYQFQSLYLFVLMIVCSAITYIFDKVPFRYLSMSETEENCLRVRNHIASREIHRFLITITGPSFFLLLVIIAFLWNGIPEFINKKAMEKYSNLANTSAVLVLELTEPQGISRSPDFPTMMATRASKDIRQRGYTMRAVDLHDLIMEVFPDFSPNGPTFGWTIVIVLTIWSLSFFLSDRLSSSLPQQF
jgi:hypothetical protein